MKIRDFFESLPKNMGNLPFYGNTSMHIGTLEKFPCIYMEIRLRTLAYFKLI
jgi:hypothetical protein